MVLSANKYIEIFNTTLQNMEATRNFQSNRGYPGSATRSFSDGAHFLNTSRENPPKIMPGVAKSTQGSGLLI
jgi:hypothetical protein